MKKTVKLSLLALVFAFISCKDNKPNSQKEVRTEKVQEHNQTDEQRYSCPMHPEVTGKQGDNCPKCGMELTEEVK